MLDGGAAIDHVELFGPPVRPDADSRNFVLGPGCAFDRSPCGTGTCATVAALTELGICPAGEDIHVQLRGGVLTIRVLPGRQLLMTGAAETVCEGITEV